jgi:GT2 family glycosyltransferase
VTSGVRPTTDLSVIVVSHGHDAFLGPCVTSLVPALGGLRAELIVVDNLGDARLGIDGTGWTGGARVLGNRQPQGFAANANQAMRAARGRHALLLNPDTVLRSGRMVDALRFMLAHPDVGILGGRLVNPDGSVQSSYRRFPTVPVVLARGLGADRWTHQPAFYRHRLMRDQMLTGVADVDWVYGAFMLLERERFLALGGMDERFFLYYEDVDLCYRYRRAGLRTCYFPGIEVMHHHARTSASHPFGSHWRWHVASAFRFFRKHGYVWHPRAGRGE